MDNREHCVDFGALAPIGAAAGSAHALLERSVLEPRPSGLSRAHTQKLPTKPSVASVSISVRRLATRPSVGSEAAATVPVPAYALGA